MLILVPRFQMEGAAFALGLGIVINNIINYLILYKHLKITPYNKNFGQLIIFIVLTTIILILFFNMLTNIILISKWYWMVFSMIFIFITTLVLSRFMCFSKQDKEVLSNIFKKNK